MLSHYRVQIGYKEMRPGMGLTGAAHKLTQY